LGGWFQSKCNVLGIMNSNKKEQFVLIALPCITNVSREGVKNHLPKLSKNRAVWWPEPLSHGWLRG